MYIPAVVIVSQRLATRVGFQACIHHNHCRNALRIVGVGALCKRAVYSTNTKSPVNNGQRVYLPTQFRTPEVRGCVIRVLELYTSLMHRACVRNAFVHGWLPRKWNVQLDGFNNAKTKLHELEFSLDWETSLLHLPRVHTIRENLGVAIVHRGRIF